MFTTWLLTALIAYLGADFSTGVIHWIIDAYFSTKSSNPLVRYISVHNELHHVEPNAFLKYHWVQNIFSSLPTYAVAMTLMLLTYPSITLGLMFTMGLFGNLVHRWTHQRPVPYPVKLLQKLYILQTPRHHRVHHFEKGVRKPSYAPGNNYCAIGNLVNPVLEAISFWRCMEYVVYGLVRIEPLAWKEQPKQ